MDQNIIPPSVRDLARQLAEPKPMRRGTVSTRYMKCNKPGCPCADDPKARHGPYVSVVRVVAGKTRSRWIPFDKADLLRRQVESGKRFRKQVEDFWDACEQWADAQLQKPKAASQEAAKKGASKKPSTRKLSPRLKRS